jgi:hypothetical protein
MPLAEKRVRGKGRQPLSPPSAEANHRFPVPIRVPFRESSERLFAMRYIGFACVGC